MASEALDFLRKLRSDGPWTLSAIPPDGGISTRTFHSEATAGKWLRAHAAANIYYALNPLLRDLDSKASKADVAGLQWLHVDIDPRAGEPIKRERERALAALQGYALAPTAIIDSGGGYQALWLLDELQRTDGDVARAEELEAYNIQLEKELGGDHCHNIDRILRLPGTRNIPNAKKRAAGRVEAPTRLVSWTGVAYALEQFTPAPRRQGTAATAGVAVGNVADVDTATLGRNHPQLGEPLLKLIEYGAGEGYPSRSEALFAVACGLVRAEVPDEEVLGVLLCAENGVSASVREKPDPERYALRQLTRAKEFAVDPWLERLNTRHAVISDIGGKCRVVSEVEDPALGRTRLSKQSFADFRNRYMNQRVEVGTDKKGRPIEQAVGNWWLAHEQRRQYEGIVFAPRRAAPGYYNLWRGFTCDALPGKGHETFLAHVRDNICAGDPELYTYLLGWMARAVQRPDSAGQVVVTLRGARGTGKSFFAREFGALFGRHYLQVSDSKHLVGAFNAHLRDTVILFGDEAFFAGDRKHESVLKTLATEESLMIEGKGVDAEVAPNYTHIILASNEDWVVPAGADERRFFVLDVGEGKQQQHAYFREIHEALQSGGREALLHYLLTYDLARYEVRNVPQTEALRDQKTRSLSPIDQWWAERLHEGRPTRGADGWPEWVTKNALYGDYIREMDERGHRAWRMSRIVFGRWLADAQPSGWPVSKQLTLENQSEFLSEPVARRQYVYYLAPLKASRAAWGKRQGST